MSVCIVLSKSPLRTFKFQGSNHCPFNRQRKKSHQSGSMLVVCVGNVWELQPKMFFPTMLHQFCKVRQFIIRGKPYLPNLLHTTFLFCIKHDSGEETTNMICSASFNVLRMKENHVGASCITLLSMTS